MSETQSSSPNWLQQPLTAEEIQQCKDAGASHAFVTMLRTDKPRGVDRHSVRIETKKQLREWGKDPEEMTRLAGHFFTALWDGRREDYIGRADENNRQLLRTAGLI